MDPKLYWGGLKLILRLVSSESLLGAMWFCPALLIVSLLSFFLFWITSVPLKRDDLNISY